jgi:hypothetical protein
MNFSIGKDNEILRETIHKFAQKEIAPLAEQIDKNKLTIDLNAALTGKTFALKAANYFRTVLLEKTKKLITEIDKKII